VKRRKGTTRPGIGVTASAVRSTLWTIQGWRPTSVTVHPASIASSPRGEASTTARRNGREANRRPRSASHPPQSESTARRLPAATMTWNARWTMATGGQRSSGNAVSPVTSASGS
jgi:hypothetical protein